MKKLLLLLLTASGLSAFAEEPAKPIDFKSPDEFVRFYDNLFSSHVDYFDTFLNTNNGSIQNKDCLRLKEGQAHWDSWVKLARSSKYSASKYVLNLLKRIDSKLVEMQKFLSSRCSPQNAASGDKWVTYDLERMWRGAPRDAVKDAPEWPTKGSPALEGLLASWTNDIRPNFFPRLNFAAYHEKLYDLWFSDRGDGRRDVKLIDDFLEKMALDPNACRLMGVEAEVLKDRTIALQASSKKKPAVFKAVLSELRILGPYAEAKIKTRCKKTLDEQDIRVEANIQRQRENKRLNESLIK